MEERDQRAGQRTIEMYRYYPTVKEGILIILVGIIGIYRTLESLPDAGLMITRMLYTMFFIFIAIVLIGIKVILDAVSESRDQKEYEPGYIRNQGK